MKKEKKTATVPTARIHLNVWGNWNGYLGTKKVEEFGEDEAKAREWLARQKWLRKEPEIIKSKVHGLKRKPIYSFAEGDQILTTTANGQGAVRFFVRDSDDTEAVVWLPLAAARKLGAFLAKVK